MKKKTLPIGAILEKANHMLSHSVDESSMERKAVANEDYQAAQIKRQKIG